MRSLVIAALCCAALRCAAVYPKAKWGQDMEQVYLTINADCDVTTKTITITNSTFAFHCLSEDTHEPINLAFTLRDDIKDTHHKTGCRAIKKGAPTFELSASRSGFHVCLVFSWGFPAGEESCTLVKAEPHVIDMLPATADAARLKSFLKVDWSRVPGDPPAPPFEDPFNDASAAVITVVTPDNIDELLASNHTLFLDVSFPWCTSCYASRKHFVKVATAVRKLNAAGGRLQKDDPLPVFGRVDAREHRSLAWRFNASCNAGVLGSGTSRPCGYVVLQQGKAEPAFVGEQHTDQDMLYALLPFIGELRGCVSVLL